jgi:hypothetical protein
VCLLDIEGPARVTVGSLPVQAYPLDIEGPCCPLGSQRLYRDGETGAGPGWCTRHCSIPFSPCRCDLRLPPRVPQTPAATRHHGFFLVLLRWLARQPCSTPDPLPILWQQTDHQDRAPGVRYYMCELYSVSRCLPSTLLRVNPLLHRLLDFSSGFFSIFCNAGRRLQVLLVEGAVRGNIPGVRGAG